MIPRYDKLFLGQFLFIVIFLQTWLNSWNWNIRSSRMCQNQLFASYSYCLTIVNKHTTAFLKFSLICKQIPIYICHISRDKKCLLNNQRAFKIHQAKLLRICGCLGNSKYQRENCFCIWKSSSVLFQVQGKLISKKRKTNKLRYLWDIIFNSDNL